MKDDEIKKVHDKIVEMTFVGKLKLLAILDDAEKLPKNEQVDYILKRLKEGIPQVN